MKKRIFCIGAMMFTFILFTETNWSKPSFASSKTVKVGCIIPLTGPAAPWGLVVQRSMKLITDEVNNKGGLSIGKEKYEVQLIILDSKASPAEAKTAAERLVSKENIKFIIGPIISPTTLAVQTITEPNKVIIFHTATASKAIGSDKPYSFMLMNNTHQRMAVLSKWLRDTYPQSKRYAIINPDNEGGRNESEFQKIFLNRYNFDVVNTTYYPAGMKDFYPLLTRMLASKPEIINLGITTPGDQGLILKQIGELGYTGLKIINTSVMASLLFKIAGDASNGTIILDEDYVGAGKFMTDEKNKFYDSYVKNYGKENWSPGARISYSYGQILFAAIEGSNSLDTDKVAAYIEKNEIPCLLGKNHMGPPAKRQGYAPIPISQLQDGKLIIIDLVPIPEPIPGFEE